VSVAADGREAIDALLAAWNASDGQARLSDKVRSAMRKKAVKGEVLGRPPFGYKVGALRRLELVPEEAVVVRYIFRLYLNENLGIRLIARRLNEEGVKTRRGGNWSMVSIRDILRNRAYLGTYARFNVRVTGTHPAIVSNEDFRRVQDRLNARRSAQTPRTASQFLLSGLAHCGWCGNKLIGVTRKQSWTRKDGEKIENTYRYYQCESRTNQSVCGYHTKRADALEAEIRSQLEASSGTEDTASAASGRRAAHDLRAAETLKSRLKATDRKLESLIDDAARGRATRQQLVEHGGVIAQARLKIEDALRAAGPASKLDGDRHGRARALARDWEIISFDDQKARLNDLVEAIQVRDEGVLIQYWG
jgi:site-specific DNA recombinase